MLLENYVPQSKLVTPATRVDQPRFPVIDAHNHLMAWEDKPIQQLLDIMDAAHVIQLSDLDGCWGEDILIRHLEHFKAKAPDRFKMFGGVDWSQWPARGNQFPDWAANRIRAQKERGAEGVKIWKPFGLQVTDQHGTLVKVDDPRLAPIWETAGELNLPVQMHLADPVAFFDPIDESNERWEELAQHPDWAFTSPPYPPFLEILTGMKNLVQRHAATTFIGAHGGCYAEILGWVSDMLDTCPNYSIDISARIGELGRQPYTTHKFFLQHQDRIVFGTDTNPDLDTYRLYYRFLESEDEYFDYGLSPIPDQGRWKIYGLNLPTEVLRKVYSGNVCRLLG